MYVYDKSRDGHNTELKTAIEQIPWRKRSFVVLVLDNVYPC